MSRPVPASDPAADRARRAKRSATISLVLVAGAGATAFGLARLDSSQRDEDVLVYGSLGACIAERVRSAEACRQAEAAARAAYAGNAPRYETLADCERHHGPGGCVPGATVTPAASDRYLPAMAAFMMGRTDEQDLPVQPLYAHAPEEERHAHAGGYAGGYCTGAGGRVFAAGGTSRAHVPASVARTTAATPRTIARGGFGGTGRAVAAASGGSGSGHGSGGG